MKNYKDMNIEQKLILCLQKNSAYLIRNGIIIDKDKYNRILYDLIHGIHYNDGKLLICSYFCEGGEHISLEIVNSIEWKKLIH